MYNVAERGRRTAWENGQAKLQPKFTDAAFHTTRCKQYALPHESNSPAMQERARSRLSSLM